MTKVDAIKAVMSKNGGKATLAEIYRTIGRYYKDARAKTEIGTAGIRGVLYREIRNGRNFRKIAAATYELIK